MLSSRYALFPKTLPKKTFELHVLEILKNRNLLNCKCPRSSKIGIFSGSSRVICSAKKQQQEKCACFSDPTFDMRDSHMITCESAWKKYANIANQIARQFQQLCVPIERMLLQYGEFAMVDLFDNKKDLYS